MVWREVDAYRCELLLRTRSLGMSELAAKSRARDTRQGRDAAKAGSELANQVWLRFCDGGGGDGGGSSSYLQVESSS